MPRLHLFEIHEQSWCPAVLRDGVRGVLQQISSRLPAYERVLPSLLEAMDAVGTTEILDLCAGAGGPWVRIHRVLGSNRRIERVRLTDLYPDVGAMRAMQRHTAGMVEPFENSVDALDVPRDMPGLRTIFAAFHHFAPQEARRLLADAVANRRGIAVFELTERTVVSTLFVAVGTWPLAFAFIPFVRPLRWSYLPLTYVIPLIPFILSFDGLVSCLRSYTPDELLAMGREVGPDYDWEAGRTPVKMSPLAVVHLTGVPRS
ncbi:class I SAM-dependent methyltransferase [Paraliomyxa miuraensis]|uniref:hypothetical protein n=1 Tax=Paraliomyxa miuraensis TaxID=376150 RepID=UPI002250627B|nr:hypothetical protein [Paraliomyxa miuraensis]MCX4239707.1 hypothetical protein [Paraliomyxa miuraensis]